MLEDIVKQLMFLKPMMFVGAAGMIIFMITMLVICNKFSFQDKNLKVIGFFYDLRVTDSIALSVSLLKFFLLFSLIFTKGKIQTIHIIAFALLVVVFNICEHRIKDCIVSFFNSIVIIGVLLLIKFLSAYMTDILFDWRILIAIILMIVFLLLYAVYDIGYCVSSIVQKRYKLKNVEKESK